MEFKDSTLCNLLREIKKLAAHASLTGAMEGGTPTLIKAYNQCLQAVKERGDAVSSQLFSQLALDATVDEVGVAAALLASVICPEPQLHPHDIMAFDEDHLGHRQESGK